MKKLFALAALIAFVLPGAVLAAEIRMGESYYLNQNETISGDLYYGGEGAYISGTANDDVIIGAGRVTVSGNVKGDLMIGGGEITISGTVEDDVRVGGGTIQISGKINGDLVVGGGDVMIFPGAVIGGDLLVGGGKVNIDGDIAGTIRGAAGEMRLNGKVGGDALLNVGKLNLGHGAVIGRNLNYSSPNEANISASAIVRGETNFSRRDYEEGVKTIFGFWGFMKLLMLLALGLFFGLIFKKPTHIVLHDGMAHPWQNLGRGFVLLIIVPILAIILMVTMVGMPLGILLFLGYAMAMILGYVFGALLTGAWIEKWIWKRELQTTWKTIVIGSLAFLILGWIPVLGGLAKFSVFLMALGAIFHSMRNEWWVKKAE